MVVWIYAAVFHLSVLSLGSLFLAMVAIVRLAKTTAVVSGLGCVLRWRIGPQAKEKSIVECLENGKLQGEQLNAFRDMVNLNPLTRKTEQYILSLSAEKDVSKAPVTPLSPEWRLTPREASVILAKGLVCRGRPDGRSALDFGGLYWAMSESGKRPEACKAKFQCIWSYFEQRLGGESGGDDRELVFRLLRSDHDSAGELASTMALSDRPLCAAECRSEFIEDAGSDLLQVDFANKRVGGGVLGNGSVQEEIRFSICPELMAVRHFMGERALQDDECMLMTGAKRFSSYRGYADRFRYAGPAQAHQDDLSRSLLVAMDATDYSRDRERQYEISEVMREARKAHTAFQTTDLEPEGGLAGVATGCWGCGAFGGDRELKAIVQWMAASQAGRRSIVFCCMGGQFETEFEEVARTLKGATVGQLYGILFKYLEERRSPTAGRNRRFFQFLLSR